MTFSEEKRRKALDQINAATGHKKYDLWGYAIDLQCRLNRAEELLEQVDKADMFCQDPGAFGRAVRDFLKTLREERKP